MRISDWSSDVCSSDLQGFGADEDEIALGRARQRVGERRTAPRRHAGHGVPQRGAADGELLVDLGLGKAVVDRAAIFLLDERQRLFPRALPGDGADGDLIERSEEHTSELQSLMRISYAVFCLKTKTKH